MRYLFAFVTLCLSVSAAAQMTMVGVENGAGASYTGPGNVISGAITWWGLRAYNTAYASGLNKIANICTPADVTCADVNSDSSGNFNLAGTPSLTCNNSGSICTVKTLYDQSGAASCTGACDVTQATIANRPILVVPGAANGCPTTAKFCMSSTFGGAQELVATAGLASSTAQPFTISIVYNNPVRQGDEYLIDSNFTDPVIISGFGGANAAAINGGGTTVTATATDGVYHAVQSVFNNAAGDINIDGSVNSVTGMGTNGTHTATFILLNSTTGSLSFGGFTQEWGIWPVGFTSTNSSNMSSNQHAYWGF
jgi:hypothetical protein